MSLYTKTILLIIFIAGFIGLFCNIITGRVMHDACETVLNEKARIVVQMMGE